RRSLDRVRVVGIEGRLDRVDRARADVAEDNAERRYEHGRPTKGPLSVGLHAARAYLRSLRSSSATLRSTGVVTLMLPGEVAWISTRPPRRSTSIASSLASGSASGSARASRKTSALNA